MWVRTVSLFVCWLQYSICLSCTPGPHQCLQLRLKVHWVIAFWLASVDASQARWPLGKYCWSSLSDDCSEHLLALKFTNRKQKLTQPLLRVAVQFCSAWFSESISLLCQPLPFSATPSWRLQDGKRGSEYKSEYNIHSGPSARPSRTLLLRLRDNGLMPRHRIYNTELEPRSSEK